MYARIGTVDRLLVFTAKITLLFIAVDKPTNEHLAKHDILHI